MGSTFQTNTYATINIINSHIQNLVKGDIPPGLKDDWKPGQIVNNKTFDCESLDNKKVNTNKNCLRALIDNCQISLVNQNDIINNNNCNSLLDYTKAFLNIWYNKTKTDYDRESTNWSSWDWEWGCNAWCDVVRCDPYWKHRGYGDKNKLYHRGPSDTDCTQYISAGGADVGNNCWSGFGAIIYRNLKNCNLMRDSDKWKTRISQYQKVINEISCPTLSVIPTPPINCCNNVLNCEYTECINIVQICKQTISGETEISNATQCLRSECPMNGQICLKDTPGAGPFNWICQNNKWVKKQPAPPPSPAPAAPAAPTPPAAPVSAPPVPAPTDPEPIPPTTPEPIPSTAPEPIPPTAPEPIPPTAPEPIPPTAPEPIPPTAPISPISEPTSSTPTAPTVRSIPSSVSTSRAQPPKTTTNYTMFIVVFVVLILLCFFSFFVASK